MASWSLYQWNSHLHHGPFRAPLRAAVLFLAHQTPPPQVPFRIPGAG